MISKLSVASLFLLSSFYRFSALHAQPQPFSSYAVLPFALADKMIVIEASVNGVKGNFIVDTGASHLILNGRYFVGRRRYDQIARNFAGQETGVRDLDVHFSWGNIKPSPYKAFVTDLSHLEQSLSVKIMGHIGYDVLKDYELLLDFSQSQITVFQLDWRGDRQPGTSTLSDPTYTLKMKENKHLPYLTGNIGPKKLRLGIDTGAAFSIFERKVKKKLGDHFQVGKPIYVADFAGETRLAVRGTLKGLTTQDLVWPPLNILFTDIGGINLNLQVPLHGLLGFDFLARYKIAINYRKNRLSIWEPAENNMQDSDRFITNY